MTSSYRNSSEFFHSRVWNVYSQKKWDCKKYTGKRLRSSSHDWALKEPHLEEVFCDFRVTHLGGCPLMDTVLLYDCSKPLRVLTVVSCNYLLFPVLGGSPWEKDYTFLYYWIQTAMWPAFSQQAETLELVAYHEPFFSAVSPTKQLFHQ